MDKRVCWYSRNSGIQWSKPGTSTLLYGKYSSPMHFQSCSSGSLARCQYVADNSPKTCKLPILKSCRSCALRCALAPWCVRLCVCQCICKCSAVFFMDKKKAQVVGVTGVWWGAWQCPQLACCRGCILEAPSWRCKPISCNPTHFAMHEKENVAVLKHIFYDSTYSAMELR